MIKVKCVNNNVGKSTNRKGGRPVPPMLLSKGTIYEAMEGEKPGTFVISSGELKGRSYRMDRFEKV